MNNVNAFGRSRKLLSVIGFLSTAHAGTPLFLQQLIANEAGKREYQSRGKGGGFRPRAKTGFLYAHHHNAGTSKYSPHQGAKEKARRLRQFGL